MRFLLRVFAVLCLSFAVCVELTLLQIEPGDQNVFDFLVACAALAAFILSGWLLLQIALTLKNLG